MSLRVPLIIFGQIHLSIMSHSNHGEGRKSKRKRGGEKTTRSVSTLVSSFLHLHVVDYLSGSNNPLRAGRCAIAQAEVGG